MHRQPRLRSRVFAFAALYAVMLFGVVVLLTAHAHMVQSRAHDVVAVDLQIVAQLEDLVRNQSAFDAEWRSAARGARGGVKELSGRYLLVTQLLETEPLASTEVPRLREAIDAYQSEVMPAAARWGRMSEEERRAVAARAESRSAAVISEGASFMAARKREIDRKLPALRRSARDMMAIALGITYIVVVLSFALASVTLSKLVRPLEALAAAAGKIAEGDLTARAPVAGDREVAQLGAAFNRMAEQIDRARGRLEEVARTDELTGLPNFRAFGEMLDHELRRAGRYGETFGILVCDIDRFKKYNDRFGHLAGNEALQSVAGALRCSLRETDLPARYGGEEFAIILANTDVTEMAAAAERVRLAVEALPAPPGRTPLTISIGGAAFPTDGTAPEQLFAAADERLYRAKSSGRNRSVVGPKSASRSA
jgi:diguanylate cyclase (GGDEF)-like protein